MLDSSDTASMTMNLEQGEHPTDLSDEVHGLVFPCPGMATIDPTYKNTDVPWKSTGESATCFRIIELESTPPGHSSVMAPEGGSDLLGT